MGDKPIASLVIHGAAKMTRRGRLAIGRWLQLQGAHLVASGAKFAPRYRARYIVATDGKKCGRG
jgi:hypothetical protein